MNDTNKKGFFSRKILFGTSIGAALFFIFVGVVFWAGFNWSMEVTNTEDFCISCHEMEQFVYQDYKKTIHYSNRSGVRASCSDCHVPDPWVHKVIRKVQASNELLHKALGTVSTPEKFDEHRLRMARRVWNAMKKTDSRECRNCHSYDSMNPEDQKGRSRKQHINAMEEGSTCIDCHKGIAHKEVHDLLTDEELDVLERPDPAIKRPMAEQWLSSAETGKAEPEPEPESEQVAVEETRAEPELESTPDTPVEAESTEKAAPVAAAAAPAASGGSSIDWSGVPAYEVILFYPGESSMEWVLHGRDHGGARPLKAGDRCLDCHEGEEVDIGELVVSGEKLEPTPIPGKRGSIVLNVRAAHDSDNLYMRFQWEDSEHAPVPFADGGKMDPDNQTKLAVMLTGDDEKVEFAERSGCWQSCHHDVRTMPDSPDAGALGSSPLAQTLDISDGVTKYLQESRTEIGDQGQGGQAARWLG